MTLITTIHDAQAQLITGGYICKPICEAEGFTKDNGNDKCRGNANALVRGNTSKNGKRSCCDVHSNN